MNNTNVLDLNVVKCPLCGQYSLRKEGNKIVCKKCNCSFSKQVYSHDLSVDDLKRFAEGKSSKYYGNLRRKDGTIYGGKFFFSKNATDANKRISIVDDKNHNCSNDIIPDISKKYYDVFISHRNTEFDKAAYLNLMETLTKNGIKVYGDSLLKAGEIFDTLLPSMIRCCRCLLVLVSKDSTSDDKNNIRAEIKIATESGIPILPYRIDNVEDFGNLKDLIGDIHFCTKNTLINDVLRQREVEKFDLYIMYDNASWNENSELSYIQSNLSTYRNFLNQLFIIINGIGCSYISECSVLGLENSVDFEIENEKNQLNLKQLKKLKESYNEQYFRKFYSKFQKVILIINHPQFVISQERRAILDQALEQGSQIIVCSVTSGLGVEHLELQKNLATSRYSLKEVLLNDLETELKDCLNDAKLRSNLYKADDSMKNNDDTETLSKNNQNNSIDVETRSDTNDQLIRKDEKYVSGIIDFSSAEYKSDISNTKERVNKSVGTKKKVILMNIIYLVIIAVLIFLLVSHYS